MKGRISHWASSAYPHLKDQDKPLSEAVRDRFLQLLETHATGRIMDDSVRGQLKLVCLAVATQQVLQQEGVSKEHAEELVALNLGSLYAPFFRVAMKGSVWVKARLLGREPWDLAVGTLRDVAVDMSGPCEDVDVGKEGDEGDMEVLRVGKCMNYDVLAAEGQEELLKHFCCSFNLRWFEAYKGYGVEAERTEWKGDGGGCCQIEISKER